MERNQKGKKSRNWRFTCFAKDWDWEELENCEHIMYGVWQLEKCPKTGKKHWQGFVQLKNPRGLKGVQTLLGIGKSWVGIADYPKAAAEYCMKKESRVKGPFEIGDPSGLGQGSRTDLKEVAQTIQTGGLLAAVKAHPDMFIKYHRGMERLAMLLEKPREEKPKIIYIFGSYGSGKTFYARRKCGGTGNYYLKDSTTKWWDLSLPGQNVIIDEMRGWMVSKSYTLMCLDGYDMNVETKGGFKKLNTGDIWITANRSPRYIGSKSGRGSKEFLRRLDKVIYYEDRKVQRVWRQSLRGSKEPEVGGNIVSHFSDPNLAEDYEMEVEDEEEIIWETK